MKRFILSLIIILILQSQNFAQKDSTVVGPGVTYYSEYRSAGPWQFDILVVNLTDSLIKLKTVKGKDRLAGQSFEKTTSMAARNDYEGHRVVGAVNGDFYNTATGEPTSTQVSDGQILKNANSRWNFAWNPDKKSMMAVSSSSGKAIKGDSITAITKINASRDTNNLILYNSYFGNSTGTNQYGSEILVNPLNGWKLNDTVICVIENKSSAGNMPLSSGKAVLSGNGTSASFINNNFNTGDTIKIYIALNPGLPGLNQLIGGGPVIVRNGTPQGDNVDIHPRTAIGITQDSTKLILVTVDGRQPGYSVGMTLLQLGNYMKEWGCYQALNLDGGGSTTMVVRGQIKNSPSDPGGERSVANSLLIISTAPTGPLHHVQIAPKLSYTVSGLTVQFSVAGYDAYYNPVAVPPASVQWTCTPSSGTINQSGLFTAGADTGIGYVYVTVGSLTDSAVVHITRVNSIILQPDPVVLQVGQHQQMTAVAKDNYNNTIPLPSSSYAWSVSGNVGTITTAGYFSATTPGSGTIKAEYDSVSGTAAVQVGISTYVTSDNFTTVSNFNLTGVLVDLTQCSLTADTNIYVSPPASGKLHYKLLTGGTSALYMNCNISVSGSPDKVGLNVYGDGRAHWLRGQFKDVDNEYFLINFTDASSGINWVNEWKYLEIPISDAIPYPVGSAIVTFPIKWTRIYIAETSDAKKDSGTIYFDDLKFHYVATSVDEDLMPAEFRLNQNFPNPFNPSTTIRFSIPEGNTFVTLKVYDILGKEAAVLVNEYKPAGTYEINFSAADLPSGIYFYRLRAGTISETRKMVLMK